MLNLLSFACLLIPEWAHSSAGRVFRSQRRGGEFESPWVQVTEDLRILHITNWRVSASIICATPETSDKEQKKLVRLNSQFETLTCVSPANFFPACLSSVF